MRGGVSPRAGRCERGHGLLLLAHVHIGCVQAVCRPARGRGRNVSVARCAERSPRPRFGAMALHVCRLVARQERRGRAATPTHIPGLAALCGSHGPVQPVYRNMSRASSFCSRQSATEARFPFSKITPCRRARSRDAVRHLPIARVSGHDTCPKQSRPTDGTLHCCTCASRVHARAGAQSAQPWHARRPPRVARRSWRGCQSQPHLCDDVNRAWLRLLAQSRNKLRARC